MGYPRSENEVHEGSASVAASAHHAAAWDEGVYLPDYVDRRQAAEILRYLTPEGRAMFDYEVRQAEQQGGEKAVNAVVHGWYRTAWHVSRDPQFVADLIAARATMADAELWSAEDLSAMRALADQGL